MTLTLAAWGGTIVFGGACFVLVRWASRLALDLGVGLALHLRTRFWRRAQRALAAAADESREGEGGATSWVSPWRFLDVLLSRWGFVPVALLAAGLAHDRMLSPVLFTICLLAGEALRFGRVQQRSQRLNADTGTLIVQFHSRYPKTRSLELSLQETLRLLPAGEVRHQLAEAGRGLAGNQPARTALRGLASLPNPVLVQFALVMGSAQETSQEQVIALLSRLAQLIRDRQDLEQLKRRKLTSMTWTIRSLQVALLLLFLWASGQDVWRAYLSGSAAGLLLLAGLLLTVVLVSVYYEAVMTQLGR